MQKIDLSKYDNSWYKTGGSLFSRLLWYCVNACVINTACPWNFFKIFLLRSFGATVGKNVVIKPRVNIKYPWNISIGDNSWIGEKVWLDSLGKINIGANVCLSQGAMLICGNHNYKKATFDLMVGTIILEEGVWIGAAAILCGNILCKSHSVVTAGSVISNDLEAYSIYQGNPAVKIKDRTIE